ncbi:MAG: type II secretion system F family protein, partial [Planctomycetota bacterium]
MATYQYTGKTTAGRRVKGLVAADSLRAARDQIRTLGVDIASVDERVDKQQFTLLRTLAKRRLSGALTEFSREMSTLLTAGVPLLDAIDCCMPQAKTGLQAPLAALRDDVASGKSLAEAMDGEAWLFDDMLRGMVRVGENSGNLDEVLDQVATFREQSEQLKNRVLSAITYPAIVFGVSILVTLFLMTVVVPMLLDNLAELGSQLPWPTRVLKFVSDALLVHGWWLALVAAAGTAALAAWARSAKGRKSLARMALRIPLLGGLIQKQAIGRMSLVIACLLRSGVELVAALRIAGESADNVVL